MFKNRFFSVPSCFPLPLLLLAVPQCSRAVDANKAVKTLHVILTTQEAALDPAVASDLASLSINENIFDPMLRYDYPGASGQIDAQIR